MSKEEKTLTVSELIACLQKFPPDMPVVAAWEGIFVGIKDENINIDSPLPYSGKKLNALIIHVDHD